MVYISGKITGNKNYEAEFNEAEIKLREMGFKVFNPASIRIEKAVAAATGIKVLELKQSR